MGVVAAQEMAEEAEVREAILAEAGVVESDLGERVVSDQVAAAELQEGGLRAVLLLAVREDLTVQEPEAGAEARA